MKVRPRFCFHSRAVLAVALFALAAIAANGAHAQSACSSLPKPVYVAGSTAVKPFLAIVAKALANLADPITVVYQSKGSCVGVGYLAATPTGTITGTGTIWDASGLENATGCMLSATGDTVDIGVSDVYASSCGMTPPDAVKDFLGPVQTMTFVVPGGSSSPSSESVISAEAAYMVFGFGNDSGAAPWTDDTVMIRRDETSGTQQMVAAAIKVPASKWKGVNAGGSGAVVTMLTAAQAASHSDQAIGIVSADLADKNRAMLKILGYQHFGQDCAYWPDSTAESFDKANVRDGHYYIWGPLHMLAHTAAGVVSSPTAKIVIDYLSGAVVPDFDLIQVEAKGSVIPDCAMRVKRTAEVGPLMSYMPDKSCSCKFEAEATGMDPPTGCTACPNGAGDCPKSAPACNYGYCEVK